MIETFKRWMRRAFWAMVGLFVLLAVGIQVGLWFSGPPAAQAVIELSPRQIRQQQIQHAIDIGEARLVAHIKANMGDPGSFELVDDRAIDAGDHITMVMTYRGRNGFNALRLERVGATFDLRGNLTSAQKIE